MSRLGTTRKVKGTSISLETRCGKCGKWFDNRILMREHYINCNGDNNDNVPLLYLK